MSKFKQYYQSSDSKKCTATECLGIGGETTVSACKEAPGIALGIPHQMTTEKEDRLRFLLSWGPAIGIRKHYAWPTDLLTDATGRVVGFAMPKVKGELLSTYLSPQTRPSTITLQFVLKIFRSLAAAIHGAHASGFRIADLNDNNVMVKDNGDVVILDVLSFSFTHSQRIFSTSAGIAEYLPQELQEAFAKSDLANQPRTIHGDSWAFAVLFWKTLMDCFHPFANREMKAPEDAVKKGHWPHSSGSPLHPKTASPPLTCLPSVLVDLFRQCFEQGTSDPLARPLILDWHKAIDELIQQVAKNQKQRGRSNGSGNRATSNIVTPVLFLLLLVAALASFFIELPVEAKARSENSRAGRETPALWTELRFTSPLQGDL